MSAEATVVAVYETHKDAEEAVKALQAGGLDMQSLAVVGKGYHTEEQVVGYYNIGDRMLHWGKLGAFWGAIWGLLFGSALFVIPGVGPILVAGTLVAAIVAALENAAIVGGLSALGAGLFSMGIPKDSAVKYEAVVRADQFLLTSHGSAEDVQRTHDILEQTHHAGLDLHPA